MSHCLFPTNVEYRSAIEQLRENEGQWAFFESSGNCVLLAGPGSGKTKSLTLKLARILSEDISGPRAVACLTYSNECVREIRTRLRRLAVNPSELLFVGTVHSFCLTHLLRPYASLGKIGIPDGFGIASEAQQRRTRYNAFKVVHPRRRPPSGFDAIFDRLRRTGVGAEIHEIYNRSWDAPLVIREYERQLRADCLIDLDDMSLRAAELAERHSWVCHLIAAKFPIIIIDEYQDLSPALHRLITVLLDRTGVRVLAVGDPDQSIYGFAGANPRLLLSLTERRDFQQFHLRFNYRCGKEIVDAAEAALGQPRGYTPLAPHQGYVFEHHRPHGLRDQAEYICDVILPAALARDPNRKPGDIAILYADRHAGDVIAAAATQRDVATQRSDKGAAYPKMAATRWLEDCAAWCAGGWRIADPTLDSLIQYWVSITERQGRIPEVRRRERQLVGFLMTHRDGAQPLRSWLVDFSDAGLRNAFKPHEYPDDQQAIIALWRATAAGEPYERLTVAEFGNQRGSRELMNLITLHGAKGLEFEVVVLMGMDQGTLPSVRDERESEEWFESKRKFYVGLTRAKHEVHMTYSGFTDNFGNRHEHGPSEFVLDVRQRLAELAVA